MKLKKIIKDKRLFRCAKRYVRTVGMWCTRVIWCTVILWYKMVMQCAGGMWCTVVM